MIIVFIGLSNKRSYWFSNKVSKPSESLFPNDGYFHVKEFVKMFITITARIALKHYISNKSDLLLS